MRQSIFMIFVMVGLLAVIVEKKFEKQETMIKYLAHEYSMLNHTCITNCHK